MYTHFILSNHTDCQSVLSVDLLCALLSLPLVLALYYLFSQCIANYIRTLQFKLQILKQPQMYTHVWHVYGQRKRETILPSASQTSLAPSSSSDVVIITIWWYWETKKMKKKNKKRTPLWLFAFVMHMIWSWIRQLDRHSVIDGRMKYTKELSPLKWNCISKYLVFC